MIEKIESNIKTQTEVLSALPKNNKQNVKAFVDEASKVLKDYESQKQKVLEEILSRTKAYDGLEENPKIKKYEKFMNSLENDLPFLNPYNTSYEKMRFNEIIYDISKYYKGNLEKVNQDILEAIYKFREASIELSAKDFNYSPFVKEYMTVFFEEIKNVNSEVLKDTFDQLYWRCPSLIQHIELNLRYLFQKNKKAFDKYIELREKHFLEKVGKTRQEITAIYGDVKSIYDELLRRDEYLYFNRFINKELKVSDYSIDKVEKAYSQYTDDKNEDYYNVNFLKLSHSLHEYSDYIEHKYLIDEVMTIYKEKEKYKNISKSKLKEIAKEEGIVNKLNNKHKSMKDKDKKDKIELDITNHVQTLYTLYQDLDDMLFQEKIITILKDNSSIESLLMLVASYYTSFVKMIKKQFNGIESNEVDLKINYLIHYLLSPYNTIITNLDISKEYNIPMIICDKYKLMNLNVPIESLDSANLEPLINQIQMIIDAYYFRNMKISLKEIDMYIQSKEILEKEKLESPDVVA